MWKIFKMYLKRFILIKELEEGFKLESTLTVLGYEEKNWLSGRFDKERHHPSKDIHFYMKNYMSSIDVEIYRRMFYGYRSYFFIVIKSILLSFRYWKAKRIGKALYPHTTGETIQSMEQKLVQLTDDVVIAIYKGCLYDSFKFWKQYSITLILTLHKLYMEPEAIMFYSTDNSLYRMIYDAYADLIFAYLNKQFDPSEDPEQYFKIRNCFMSVIIDHGIIDIQRYNRNDPTCAINIGHKEYLECIKTIDKKYGVLKGG